MGIWRLFLETLLTVISAFLISAGTNAAEITGRVHFKGALTETVKVGYEGVTSAGAHITNMAGLTPTGSTGYVWCDTYKPRRTGLMWSSTKGLTFQHTNLPKGTYLVYVKYGDAYLDWKVITVSTDSARVNTSLAISPSRMGDVEIAVTLVLRSVQQQGAGSLFTDVGTWAILVKAGKTVRYSVP